MTEASRYIHGVTPAEQERLSTLNRLLNPGSLRELAIRPGDRVLEVGSGLGELARAMGRASGVPVVAVERSSAQLSQARRCAQESGESALVDFREGDARSLPLGDAEWGTFDVAHCRFLLEHLPDPASAVAEMARAVRPGGRIVLEDDDHDVLRLWPEPAGLAALWSAYVRTYDRIGNDPFAGRRLVSLLHAAGATPVRNQWLFFGSCAGERDFATYAENLAGVLESARREIVEAGLLEEGFLDRTVEEIRAWSRRPDAAIWYAVCWAEGVKPGVFGA
ncbi:MAG: methyltransferase domain-containing protein [Thermoanaerobaculia bacterium]